MAILLAAVSCRKQAPEVPESTAVRLQVGMAGTSAAPTKALDFEVGTDAENAIHHLWLIFYKTTDLTAPTVYHFVPGATRSVATVGTVQVQTLPLPAGAYVSTYTGQNRETVYKPEISAQPGSYWAAFLANTKLPDGTDLVHAFLSGGGKSAAELKTYLKSTQTRLFPVSGTRQPLTHRDLSVYTTDGLYASRIFDESAPLVIASGSVTPSVITLYRRVARLRVLISNVDETNGGLVYPGARTASITSLALSNHHYVEGSDNDLPLALDAVRENHLLPAPACTLSSADLGRVYQTIPLYTGITRAALFPGMAAYFAADGALNTATGPLANPYTELIDLYIPADPPGFLRSADQRMVLRLGVKHGARTYRYTVPVTLGNAVTASDLSDYWFLGSGEFNPYSILRNFIYEVKLSFQGVAQLEVVTEGQIIQEWTDPNGWYED